MLISDKSDQFLESRCDQLKFFLVVIFGILPQKELYNEKILKIDFIINFPPLFFASEVKNAKKVTLPKNAKKTPLFMMPPFLLEYFILIGFKSKSWGIYLAFQG